MGFQKLGIYDDLLFSYYVGWFKLKIRKLDKLSRIQLLVTGSAFILFLIFIITYITFNPLNENSYIYTVCIIIVGLVWIYSFYRNLNRHKFYKNSIKKR